MKLFQEIFIKLSKTINDWEDNYELVIEGNVLYLRYVGTAFDQNEFLDLPYEPYEEDYEDDEEDEGETDKYEEFCDAMEDWKVEVENILNTYCDDLSGADYKVSILGEYTNSKGFVYIFS